MTEAEWLACQKRPDMMLAALKGTRSERRLRLFLCACARRLYSRLTPPEQSAVTVAERAADCAASSEDLAAANALLGPTETSSAGGVVRAVVFLSAELAAFSTTKAGFHKAARGAWSWPEPWPVWKRFQCDTLRDIFGNSPRVATSERPRAPITATSLATAAYEERLLPSGHIDNLRLAVLSDALEEAGCTDAALLAHLRSPGPHVRGCWALDLVLGKQ